METTKHFKKFDTSYCGRNIKNGELTDIIEEVNCNYCKEYLSVKNIDTTKHVSYNLELTHPTQKEWDEQTSRIINGFKNGTIFKGSGCIPDAFDNGFEKNFKEGCNTEDIKPLIEDYKLALFWHKDNNAKFNEAHFIKGLKRKINEIIDNEQSSIPKNKYYSYGNEFIEFLEERIISSDNPKLQKTFSDFIINVEDKAGFTNELKETFNTEKGKSIRAIIDILIENNCLVKGAREYKNLVNAIAKDFDRDIGKYQSIQNPKQIEKEIIDPIKINLLPIIKTYKSI